MRGLSVALNIERFKADLERLLELGGKLELALRVKVYGKEKLKEDFKLGPVWNQDSHPITDVIQAMDGPIRFD